MEALFELYGAHTFWIWVAVAGALLAAEVATGSGWLLWPSASAALIGFLTLFIDLSWPVAILGFAAVTIVTTLLSRRLIARGVQGQGDNINDPVDRLAGRHGKAVTSVTAEEGRVFVDGKEWPAALAEGEALAPGDPVEVTGVSGAQLTVRRAR